MLSSEVSGQKANTHHLEIEVSQMQDSMRDRNAIFNSEIANLQSSIRSERELQLQKSGFTEQEIAAFLSRKIHEAVDDSKREILSLETMLNCEGEVARLYKGRFEEITKVTSGMDSETKTLTLALKDRLDREVSASGSKEATISELRDEVEDVRKQYRMEKWQADLNERNKDKFLKALSEQERACRLHTFLWLQDPYIKFSHLCPRHPNIKKSLVSALSTLNAWCAKKMTPQWMCSLSSRSSLSKYKKKYIGSFSTKQIVHIYQTKTFVSQKNYIKLKILIK